jgi:hypothetical protein
MIQVLTVLDLDYKQIQLNYHTIFPAEIQYSTQLTSFLRPTLLEAINKCNNMPLQKMGYSSATPKGIYFGHKTYVGLEILDPYVYQGAQNITNLIQSLQNHHPNRSLIQATYLWWVYQDGRSKCPLTVPNSLDSITESIWYSELKVFFAHITSHYICKFRYRLYNVKMIHITWT